MVSVSFRAPHGPFRPFLAHGGRVAVQGQAPAGHAVEQPKGAVHVQLKLPVAVVALVGRVKRSIVNVRGPEAIEGIPQRKEVVGHAFGAVVHAVVDHVGGVERQHAGQLLSVLDAVQMEPEAATQRGSTRLADVGKAHVFARGDGALSRSVVLARPGRSRG